MNGQRKIIGKLVRVGSAAAEQMDQDFWRGVDAETKFAAAWEMVAEVDAFRGGDGNQPRLQRTVQHIQRLPR